MDGGEKRGGIFGVARGDAAPTLQFLESVFHQMPLFVDVMIVLALDFAILFRRDHSLHSGLLASFHDRVAIVPLVRQQILSVQAFDQSVSLRTIRRGTCRNNNSERITMRIHGHMYLGIEPPFVRPTSCVPPFAPIPSWWTLM